MSETADGSVVLAGFSIAGATKIARPFMAKLNSAGTITWLNHTSNHNYQLNSGQQLFGMAQLSTGGFVTAGWEFGSYTGTGEGQYTVPLRISPTPNASMGGSTRPGIWDGVLTWHGPDGIPYLRRWVGGAGLEQLNGVAVGPSDTIFTAGWSDGSVNGPSAGGFDLLVNAFTPTGSLLWNKQLGGAGNDRSTAIAATSDGGVVVVGHTTSSFAGLRNGGAEDAFLIRLNARGDLIWARSISTPGPDHAYGVYVMPDGDVLVTGRMAGTDWSPTGGDQGDAFLARYAANGDLRWLRRFGSNAYEYGRSIAVTSNGDLLVSGRTQGSMHGMVNQGGFDGFISRFSADGILLDGRVYGTPGNDSVNQVLTLSDGDVIVGVMSEGNYGGLGNTSGGYDLFIERLSFTRTSPPAPTPTPTPIISLAVSPASVSEDGDANLIYTFSRTGSTTNPLTVNFSITGTANASDYSGASPGSGRSISFAAGSSTATLIIDPTPDTIVEPDETVILTLTPGSGYSIGSPSSATGIIRNDDSTPTPPSPGSWSYDWASAKPLGNLPGILLAKLTLPSFRQGEPNLNVTALRVDLKTPGLSLSATGRSTNWQENQRETLTQTTRNFITTSRQTGTPVVAAINTGFFSMTDETKSVATDLKGLAVNQGVLVSPVQTEYPGFVFDPVTGARIIDFRTTPSPDPSRLTVATAGMAHQGIILKDGIIGGDDTTLTARTALGLTRDNRFLTLLTVDRSIRSTSPTTTYWGATIRDSARLLLGLGSYNGLNLDGGGSTQLAWWNPGNGRSELLNSPLAGFERHVGSNLGITYVQP